MVPDSNDENVMASKHNRVYKFHQLVSLFSYLPAVELRSDYLRTYLNWTSAYGIENLLTLSFDELLTKRV